MNFQLLNKDTIPTFNCHNLNITGLVYKKIIFKI
jgi:hypothetical protein